MVSSPDKKVLYAIGGHVGSVGLGAGYYTNDIFKFHCTGDINTCRWTESETTLRYGRDEFVAIPIPNSLADKLCAIDLTTVKPTNPTTSASSTDPTGPCDFKEAWIGDGYCDDGANNADCGYDGGDCCGDVVYTEFCDECICHPTNAKPTDPTTTTEPMDLTDLCDYLNAFGYIGNGECDDDANIAECGYDGGDCCGDDVNTEYCDECICHSTNLTTVDQTNLTTIDPTNLTTVGQTNPTTAKQIN